MADLEQKLRPVGLKDRETLLALKKEEHDAKGLPFDGEFYLWDYRYYDRKFIEQSLDLDDMLVKEYFPVSFVVPAVIDIYSKLLGVQFIPTKADLWHPGKPPSLPTCKLRSNCESRSTEAQAFAVWKADAKSETDFIGYCYLDLFPRGAYPSRLRSQRDSF